MNAKNKSSNLSNYLAVFIIIIFGLLLIYYALTANTVNKLSVSITSWELTNFSKAVYPINIVNVSSFFNYSSGQLSIGITINNGGKSAIGYLSGCESAFSGKVYPISTANLTYEKNVASCNVISIAKLLPNQTVELKWPYSPQIIRILQPGNLYANLTFPFGFYNLTKVYCPTANSSCPANTYKFIGFTENATIRLYLSAIN